MIHSLRTGKPKPSTPFNSDPNLLAILESSDQEDEDRAIHGDSSGLPPKLQRLGEGEVPRSEALPEEGPR